MMMGEKTICCENDEEDIEVYFIFSIFPWCWCSSGHQENVRDVEFVTWWIKVTGPGVSWCYHRVLDVIIEWVLCHQGVVWLTFLWWIVHLLMETVMKIGQLIAWLSSCVWSAGSWSRDNLWEPRVEKQISCKVQFILERDEWWSRYQWWTALFVSPRTTMDEWWTTRIVRPNTIIPAAPSGYNQAGGVGSRGRDAGPIAPFVCVWLFVPILSGSVLAKQN